MGVAWNGSDASMRAFVARHGLTFPNAADDTGELFRRFGVLSQPAWVFVDAKGNVQRTLGELTGNALIGRLEALNRSA